MGTRFTHFFKQFIPFEVKRKNSLFSIFLVFVILRVFEGVLNRIGEIIADGTFSAVPKIIVGVARFLFSLLFYPIETNPLQLLLLLVVAVPLYVVFDKLLLSKKSKEVVFSDNFREGNKGWVLNYWGSNNPAKTNRIENSQMVFEASDDDLTDPRKENGAYIDLTNGIYEGYEYEVSCRVKSTSNATTGFQLWLHDIKGGESASKKSPSMISVLSKKYEVVSVRYKANANNAIRVHLHTKAGKGKIFVDSVSVVKI